MHRSAHVAIILLALCAAPALAVELTYSATRLVDAPSGPDRWLYEYQVDEFPFTAGFGFTVYFESDLYAELETETTSTGYDWNAISREPDASLGSDGFYDAQARFNQPDARAIFRVSFDWLGAGAPGDQVFEVREPFPSFDLVENGITVVPEPTALVQHASAALALVALAAGGRPRC